MPKFPAIPRVSIVVPVTEDLSAFERTLISVLENQPAGCEILVPHDGSYEDPYELCDEVQFVLSDSSALVDLVAAAAAAARGRFVHVLSDGVTATAGWVDAALAEFDHPQCGLVAPVIGHSSSNAIVAAGWKDSARQLEEPANCSRRSVATEGVYLQASFWRREVLRSLNDAVQCRQPIHASYAYSLAARQAGWMCKVASDSHVALEAHQLPWEKSTFARGAHLRAIANHFRAGTGSGSVLASIAALLSRPFTPSAWSEAIGQAAAPLFAQGVSRQIRGAVNGPHEEMTTTLKMPSRSNARPVRQAA